MPRILSKVIVLQPGPNNGIKLNTSCAQMLTFLIVWNLSKTNYHSHCWELKAVTKFEGVNPGIHLEYPGDAPEQGLRKGMDIPHYPLWFLAEGKPSG